MGKLKAKNSLNRRGRSRAETGRPTLDYMDDVHRPVTCLAFLLPFVVVYEAGMLYASRYIQASQVEQVIAFQLLRKFLALFGATEYFLPGLAMVAILVAMQIAGGGKWKVRSRTLLGMLLESTLLAIPLLVLSHVANSYSMVMQASTNPAHTWLGDLLLSVGAGIYEELLFRLIFISVMSILLMDLAGIGEGPAIFSIMLLSAFAFSFYHYLGNETFTWHNFVFRAMAGGYLSGVFILRGFGIVVGCHVVYDLAAMILNHMSQ